MTPDRPAAVRARPAAFAGGGLRRVLVALCLTQVTSWGVLYYAFPVLSGRISADTGWTASTLGGGVLGGSGGLGGARGGRWVGGWTGTGPGG